jgi:uncharacterized protein (TIGR03435 family)
VSTAGTTVNDLIVFGYGVHFRQISGAPAWVESDKFDISGKPEGGGRPNPDGGKERPQADQERGRKSHGHTGSQGARQLACTERDYGGSCRRHAKPLGSPGGG